MCMVVMYKKNRRNVFFFSCLVKCRWICCVMLEMWLKENVTGIYLTVILILYVICLLLCIYTCCIREIIVFATGMML